METAPPPAEAAPQSADTSEKKRRFPIRISKRVCLILAVVLVIGIAAYLVPQMPKRFMLGDLLSMIDESKEARICLYHGSEFQQSASTEAEAPVNKIVQQLYSGIEDQKVWEYKSKKAESLREKINASNYISLMLRTENYDFFHLYVSEDGAILLSGRGYITGFDEGYEELYTVLKAYLPTSHKLRMSDVIPDAEWNSFYFAAHDSSNDDASAYIPGWDSRFYRITRNMDAIRSVEVTYGGEEYPTLNNDYVYICFETKDREQYILQINENGNGEVPVGDWTYSVCNAMSIVRLLTNALS